MPDDKRARPGMAAEASNENSLGAGLSLNGTRNAADLARLARRHDFGVLLLAERRDGVVVSQVFASLDAAERKVYRTRERGLSASLTIVRLVPVPHLTPTDLAGIGGAQ